ncbi:MAG: hypothetical protein FWD35_02665 [Oscillospiraceae bacterium]|nr:hypothetical protein [Oscillospiraceae bacterium]
MTTINIIGRESDKALEELILTQLTQTYRVTYVKNKSLVQAGQGYELLIADFTELKSLFVPQCLLIMKNGGSVPNISFPESTIVVASSDNREQLLALKDLKCTVITCGGSEKDTLSCSSYGSNALMVSLNREIVAFSGRSILPLEMPLKLCKSPKDIYYPLAFTALRLILDDFNSDLGKLIGRD